MILEGHFLWHFDLDRSTWYWSFMRCSSLVPDFFLCFHVLFQQQSAIWRGYITSLSGDGVSTAIAKLTSVTLCLNVSIVPTCMEEDVFRNVMEIEILTDSATACDFATPREKLVIMLQLTWAWFWLCQLRSTVGEDRQMLTGTSKRL